MTRPPPDQVALGTRFYREAGGFVRFYLLDIPTAARLNAKATAGDPEAARVMRSVGAWACRVFHPEMPESGRPRCLVCDVLFAHDGEPAALVCTTPNLGDDSAWVVIAGMCNRCAASGATGKAIAAWKRQWPTALVVPALC